MFYACSYSASYSQILNCVRVRVRGFFSSFFIVSMDILSEINFMMMMTVLVWVTIFGWANHLAM